MGSGAKPPLLFIAFFTSHRSPLSERLKQARRNSKLQFAKSYGGGGGGVLPYMGYIGMCRCEGYGSQVVYSRIWYINQSVWV